MLRMTENTVKLVTSDGQTLEIHRDYIKMAHTIWTMVEDRERVDPNAAKNLIVPLPIRAPVFAKVAEWCREHKDDPAIQAEEEQEAEIDGIRRTDDISPWDEQFMRRIDKTSDIIELYNGVNYLDIKELCELCLKTLANKLKGRTAEEIREVFGLQNDLGPADLEQIRIENSWILEDENQTEPLS